MINNLNKKKQPEQVKQHPVTSGPNTDSGERTTQGAIGERNRIALAYIELIRDKIFQKLPEAEKMALVKKVLSIGDEVADWVLKEFGINDPRKIAAQMGVKVLGEERSKRRGSEYRAEKKEIVIYRDFHDKLLREVRAPELSENLLKFVVAHELFHHLEIVRVGEVYKRFKFKRWQLGPMVKEGYIKGLSKVAAQAFTQTLLKLQILPEVFDYLTYVVYSNK